jgi:hypothetical protein
MIVQRLKLILSTIALAAMVFYGMAFFAVLCPGMKPVKSPPK